MIPTAWSGDMEDVELMAHNWLRLSYGWIWELYDMVGPKEEEASNGQLGGASDDEWDLGGEGG
jgi:hypothetical protein